MRLFADRCRGSSPAPALYLRKAVVNELQKFRRNAKRVVQMRGQNDHQTCHLGHWSFESFGLGSFGIWRIHEMTLEKIQIKWHPNDGAKSNDPNGEWSFVGHLARKYDHL